MRQTLWIFVASLALAGAARGEGLWAETVGLFGDRDAVESRLEGIGLEGKSLVVVATNWDLLVLRRNASGNFDLWSINCGTGWRSKDLLQAVQELNQALADKRPEQRADEAILEALKGKMQEEPSQEAQAAPNLRALIESLHVSPSSSWCNTETQRAEITVFLVD